MRNSIVLLLIALLVSASWVRAEAPAVSSRQAYLKLIDRPKVPAEVEEKEMPSPDGFKQTHLAYNTEAGQRVAAIALRPMDVKPGTRLPVVIVLHGTGGKKESQLSELKTFAGRGFLAIAPDGRYHGERITEGKGTEQYYAQIAKAFQDGKSHPWLYDTTWDVMRLVDYLCTRDDVDAKRIGLMGFSKGGMETYLTAAADERIAVAIPCIGVQSYKWALENDQWKGRIGTVKPAFEAAAKQAGVEKPDKAFVRTFYDRVIPGIYEQFDGPSVLPTIAPRPLLVINGDTDDKTPVPGIHLAADAAKKAYDAAGTPEKFKLIIQENTGHQVKPAARKEAVEWFVKWLQP